MAEADHTHVDELEALDADSPRVGAGTADTAPEVEVDEGLSGLPTRKLVASTVTGLVVYGLSLATGVVDPALEQAATVVGMLAAAYVVPNLPTPGGVPHR